MTGRPLNKEHRDQNQNWQNVGRRTKGATRTWPGYVYDEIQTSIEIVCRSARRSLSFSPYCSPDVRLIRRCQLFVRFDGLGFGLA